MKVCGNLFFLRVTTGLFFTAGIIPLSLAKKRCDNLR